MANYLKIPVWLAAVIALAIPVCSWADLGGSVMRDYPVALTVPKGRLELGVDYLTVRSAEDLFDREAEDALGLVSAPGDMWGLRLVANYGLLRRTTLMVSGQLRDFDFGPESLAVRSLDVGLKQNILNQRRGALPKVAVDLGMGFNWGDDLSLDFGDETDAGQGAFALQDAKDWTASGRLTVGWVGWRFFPNFFAEYGYTRMEGTASWAGVATAIDRSEQYIKAGLSLLIKFPYRALLHLEYHRLWMFRDDGLDEMPYNNIFKAEFNYHITPSFIAHLGATYFHRQLNGEIPFLYNEVTQFGFERDYGYAYAGVTVLFGGR